MRPRLLPGAPSCSRLPQEVASGPPAGFTLTETKGDTLLTLSKQHGQETVEVDVLVNEQVGAARLCCRWLPPLDRQPFDRRGMARGCCTASSWTAAVFPLAGAACTTVPDGREAAPAGSPARRACRQND